MENMRFKVGDRVKIKSLDWYNNNINAFGTVCFYDTPCFIRSMKKYCDKVMTITEITNGMYRMKEDNSIFCWTDKMIECLVKEETISDKVIEEVKTYGDSIKTAWICPDGYVFKDKNGNIINATTIVLEKKKKEYPKTYEECCKILGLLNVDLCFNADYRSFDASKEQWKKLGLMNQFYQLLICRDAYWKIAGEEMGLGKPWEPDWKNSEERRYCIVNIEGDINLPEKVLTKWILKVTNKILVFPTEEMRDAFKENFDPDIEICKELL